MEWRRAVMGVVALATMARGREGARGSRRRDGTVAGRAASGPVPGGAPRCDREGETLIRTSFYYLYNVLSLWIAVTAVRTASFNPKQTTYFCWGHQHRAMMVVAAGAWVIVGGQRWGHGLAPMDAPFHA